MFEIHVNKVRQINRLAIEDGAITIGRSSQRDVVLPGRAVSREHCSIVTEAGVSRVVDHDSHYGTLVNGTRIERERVLDDGDVIDVGGFQIVFSREGSRADAANDSQADAHATGHGESSAPTSDPTDERATELDARNAELDQRETALRAAEAALAERAATVETRERDLMEREASVTRLASDLDVRAASIADDAHAAESRDQTLTEREATLAADREALERHESTVADERDSAIAACASLQEQADTQASKLAEIGADTVRLQRDLDAERARADGLAAQEADRCARLKDAETARREAGRQVSEAAQIVESLQANAIRLFRVARRVDDARRLLPTLEEAWFEADQSVEDAEANDPEALEPATEHRESVAGRLENTHAELDAALEELGQELERFESTAPVAPVDVTALPARRFRLPSWRRRGHRTESPR